MPSMGIMRTAEGGLLHSQESYMRDLLKRFREHETAAANSVKLQAYRKIRLNAGGSSTMKIFPCETSGE